MARLIVPVWCLLLLSSCTLFLDGSDSALPEPDQTILFEVEHVNYAWGAVWEGLYVDGQGRVYRYSLGEARWHPARDDAFTEAELLEKYRHGRTLLRTIPLDELGEHAALIEPASRGVLSEPVSRCRDAGVVNYRAYRYDAQAGLYTPVLLRTEGDWAQDNPSASAHALVAWLRSLDDRFAPSWGCAP